MATVEAPSVFVKLAGEVGKELAFIGLDHLLDVLRGGDNIDEILDQIHGRLDQLNVKFKRLEDSLDEIKDLQIVSNALEVELQLKEFLYKYRQIINLAKSSQTSASGLQELQKEMANLKQDAKIIPGLLRSLHGYIVGGSRSSAGRTRGLAHGFIAYVLKKMETADKKSYSIAGRIQAIRNYFESLVQFQDDSFQVYNATCPADSIVCLDEARQIASRLAQQAKTFDMHVPAVLLDLSVQGKLTNIKIMHPGDNTALFSMQNASIVKEGFADWDKIDYPENAGLGCRNSTWSLAPHPDCGYVLQSEDRCYLAFDKQFRHYKAAFPLFWLNHVQIDRQDFLICQENLDENVAAFLLTADTSRYDSDYTFREVSTRKYLNVQVQETAILQEINQRLTLVTFLNDEKENSWKIQGRSSQNTVCDKTGETKAEPVSDPLLPIIIGVPCAVFVVIVIIICIVVYRKCRNMP